MVPSIRWLRARTVRWLALAAIFLVLALASIWPAPRSPYEVLPTGWSAPGTVPMLNAWTIWWNADRLTHGLAGYWNAPIFHPEPGTFAFSEPQPATWIVAPMVWLAGSPLPAYQAYLVATLVLNALFAVRLLRTLRAGWMATVAGGVAVLLLPLVHQDRETVQLMALWGVLWTLDSLVRLRRQPSWPRGLVLGLAFSSVFLACIHHGLFLALLLGLNAWLTVPRRRWKPWLAAVVVAGLTASLLLTPLLLPLRHLLARRGFTRSAVEVQSLSATASDWFQAMPGAAVNFTAAQSRSARPLSPGWIRTGLALTCVLLAMRRRRDRRAVLFLAALGCWSLFWSFGANLRIGAWQPWHILAEWAPGFSQVRSAYRFAYFGQLAVVLLAAVGLDRLSRSRAVRPGANRAGRLVSGLFVLSCALVAFEVPPAPLGLVSVPDVAKEPAWAVFVRRHTPAHRAIVCLPFMEAYSADDYERSAKWMLFGTWHGVAMVNGYSGFFPDSWVRMVEALKPDPFSECALDVLAAAGVEYVVIEPRLMPKNQAPSTVSKRHHLVRVFRDESGVEIWRLQERG
ncbi:MAG: hypothetical protein GX575_04805 [Candidatus Anammoximicrobium sp.]|nr:hypothetical protein [Candidatus Anammoximicrobium sp.]